MSVKRKVTVPEGSVILCFLQCQLNGLFYIHGSALRPKRMEFRFGEHGTQLSDLHTVFRLFIFCHWRLNHFAHCFCGTQKCCGALWFLLVDSEKAKAFQLMGDGGAIAKILPTPDGISIH